MDDKIDDDIKKFKVDPCEFCFHEEDDICMFWGCEIYDVDYREHCHEYVLTRNGKKELQYREVVAVVTDLQKRVTLLEKKIRNRTTPRY